MRKYQILTAVLVGIILIMSIAYAEQRNRLIDQYEADIATLIEEHEGVIQQYQTDYGQVSEMFAKTLQDVRDKDVENQQLKDHIKNVERKYSSKVREAERLRAAIDSLLIDSEGEVTFTDENAGFVSLSEDTLGVQIHGKVFFPSGKTNLLVTRDPIEFFITLQESESGAFVKKSIVFPDQPWISVQDWDVYVERNKEPEKEPLFSLFTNPFEAIKDARLIVGGRAGPGPLIGEAGVRLKDLIITYDTEGYVGVAKEFRLW